MRKSKRSRRAEQPPVFDPRLRYDVVTAARFLSISRAQLYKLIAAGEIGTIKEAGRRFVPGSEVARRSTLVGAA